MNQKRLALAVLLALLLAACAPKATPMPTPDIGAIQTAAAQTVIADVSATANAAASLTPLASPTLEPTATLAATLAAPTLTTPIVLGTRAGLCDDAVWVTDITIPDGSIMTAGQEFLKTWKIRNTGDCTWGAGYTLVYGGYNDKMGGVPAALTTSVLPNQEVEVSVQFKAPAKAGEYLSAWRMANASGYAFGEFLYVKIIVR